MPALGLSPPKTIHYPESDGQPMAENTLQYEWIVTIKGNLDVLFADRDDVFVAGDLFWYPVQGEPGIRQAPDTLVVFGRPKEHRPSYKQWEEGGIAPQVVWEIMSPSNRRSGEMERKFQFYERYGVEEYYVYDPEFGDVSGWIRKDGRLTPIPNLQGWVSPLLGVRFEIVGKELRLHAPNGEVFRTFSEVFKMRNEAQRREAAKGAEAEHARRQAEHAKQRAEQAAQREEQAAQRANEAAQRAEQERIEKERLQRLADEQARLIEQLREQLKTRGGDSGKTP
jgi:Uma2 family endonuclease